MTNEHQKTVLITGASGHIGHIIREHFARLGWKLILMDCKKKDDARDDAVHIADLSSYDPQWARHFAGVDAVVHLAADPRESAEWDSVWRNNVLATENVIRAAREHNVGRMVFASSNWVMGGYRFSGTEKLTTDMPPAPINPYGISKLIGERLGAVNADILSFIALRIGYNQPYLNNKPGSHMGAPWFQHMWLSDQDLCAGVEKAVTAKNVRHAVLNLMSNNPGMRWDLEKAKAVTGYEARDGATPEITRQVLQLDNRDRKNWPPLSHSPRETISH